MRTLARGLQLRHSKRRIISKRLTALLTCPLQMVSVPCAMSAAVLRDCNCGGVLRAHAIAASVATAQTTETVGRFVGRCRWCRCW
jgi:hypothetical protein